MSECDVMVVGGGAWGTALAIQAHRAGARTTLWLRDAGQADTVRATRRNARLPGAVLPDDIGVTSQWGGAAQLIVLAVPAQALRGIGPRLADAPVVVCAKGMEQATGKLPLDVLRDERPELRAMVLTGPNFAQEVAAGLPAAAVIAGDTPVLRALASSLLGTPAFRLYGNDDPIGAQIGGAAKNVIAIAAGAVIGAGLGENARAALVTRGLAELGRLAVAMGGRAETIAGLSGMGDLLLTCTGQASRNYRLGHALGQGITLQAARAAISGIAEGVATAPGLRRRAEILELELPICETVAFLLDGSMMMREAIDRLLSRPRREE